jgi:Na+-translocating ferredoxin:NAD+ oxidoreductase subunit B
VHCNGGSKECPDRFIYQGLQDCVAAHKMAGGPKGCEYGCLGLGTCVNVCPFGALRISDRGIAEVGPECTGCGLCVSSCPRGLLELELADPVTVLLCTNTRKGQEVRKICTAGCIACGICVKNCPQQAIILEHNLAAIDQVKCNNCGTCVEKCPTKSIQLLPGLAGYEEQIV